MTLAESSFSQTALIAVSKFKTTSSAWVGPISDTTSTNKSLSIAFLITSLIRKCDTG